MEGKKGFFHTSWKDRPISQLNIFQSYSGRGPLSHISVPLSHHFSSIVGFSR